MDLPSDKAPGSDRYTALFFKKCWPIIGVDLMRAVHALECKTSRNLNLLNFATMILLPKSLDDVHPKDFRPISLVHFFAKLFTKILALHLGPRMHELVTPCQSAFIKDRAVHDNFVFVRAQARLFRQKKTPALQLKLDLQKAFDSISWEFLLEVLEANGFGQRWRDWIACLLLTASTKIIVNGELTTSIIHRRGLRQGDPLSPLLFVIATDILAELFAMADRAGAPRIGSPCLPLSDKKLCKGDLQPALDKLAGKAIDKLRRGFLWNKDELATGSRCLIRWAAICRPLEFGGLGISDLQRKAAALRVRWMWQQWNSTDKPWSDLPIAMDDRARSLFNADVEFKLGDGQKISFWRDPWLDGCCLANLASDLFKACTMRNLSVG
ncbi:hypothetical protein ACQ4PT_056936 [Festuca glaucescens]